MKLGTLIKKDLRLMLSGKLFLTSLISLVLFSLYIGLFYAGLDTAPPTVAVFGGDRDLAAVAIAADSPDGLRDMVESGAADIGVDMGGERPTVYQAEGDSRTLALHAAYGLRLAAGTGAGEALATAVTAGPFAREEKNRREITNEALFFEVIAVGFLGISAMLFREKAMGVIRVHGVLPVGRVQFILSKVIVFLLSDLVFAALLIGINVGPAALPGIFLPALPHLCLLSLLTGLLGLLFSLIYREFRHFSICAAIIILLMTSPVFLGANRAMGWTWLDYYPVYHLFMALKNAFWGLGTGGLPYYLSCLAIIAALLPGISLGLKKEMGRG